MSNLETLIDAFGELKDQIAELEAKETKLKKELKELGVGTHIGKEYILTIAEQEREVLDQKAVREHLSRQFIAAHTSITKFPVFRAMRRSIVNRKKEEAA